MTKEKPVNNNKIKIIFLVAILVISIVVFLRPALSSIKIEEIPTYTSTYSPLSPQQAHDIITTNASPITIVDVRSCQCKYDTEHIPGAIWNTNPTSFYNTMNDLIVYDNNGTESMEFCKQLVGNTYGSIYYLDGGINAWKKAGYQIT
jgi:rhodanese-related sulfurtransferase